MSWRVVRLSGDLGPHAAQWEQLNARLTGGNPMLDAAFVGGLLRRFGTGGEHLCVFERDGTPIAMVILVQRAPGIWRGFLPAQAQVGLALVADWQPLSTLPAALPASALLVDLLCHDPALTPSIAASELRFRTQRHALTMSITLEPDFERYWAERPKGLRDNLKRYLARAVTAGGDPSYRALFSVPEVLDGVRRYADLEARGWKGSAGTALGSSGRQFDFYRDLLEHHAERGQAMVSELWHQGRLAASRLSVVQNGIVVALKTTFDESMRQWAPGRVLMQRFIRDAFTRWPGARIEFYTDATTDQLAWADEQRSIVDVTLFPNPALAWLGAFWYALRQTRGLLWRAVLPRPDPRERVVVVRDPAELSKAARRLLDRAERTNVEWGPGWFGVYSRTVMARSSGVRFLELQRGPCVSGVVACNVDPGMSRLGGGVGSLSSFYTSSWSPALGPSALGLDLVPLVAEVRRQSGGTPRLRFSPMDPSSREFGVFRRALRLSRYAVFESVAHGNWYLPVDCSFAEYLLTRPSSVRNNLKRFDKRAPSSGIRLEIVDRPEGVDDAVAAYNAVYAHSWKRAEPVDTLILETARLCADRGWLRMGLAWLGDTPIAAQYWIVANGRAAIFKMAYDERHKQHGAGNALTGMLLRHCIDVDKVREVDYLIGDDAYKRQWMSRRREMVTLEACDLLQPAGWWWAARLSLGRVESIRRLRDALRRLIKPAAPPEAPAGKPTMHLGATPMPEDAT